MPTMTHRRPQEASVPQAALHALAAMTAAAPMATETATAPVRPGRGGSGDLGPLLRFKSLMAADGQPVQLARMCYDRLYAYDRIACAHTSANDPLRRLALELFQTYHRRDEARRLTA